MAIELGTPTVGEVGAAVAALAQWQYDDAPMQLHPGDVGWFWRFGADATAAAVRTWRRDGRIVAVGLLDGPGLLRMTLAPELRQDEELSQQVAVDVSTPERGVLPAGEVRVEAPRDALVQDLLHDAGWGTAEPWTPLRRDLADPLPDPGVRIEVVGAGEAPVRAEVQRASFDRSTFTPGHWDAMAAGPAYADARCLLAYDDRGVAVAAVTVWSAGPGRPGLIEPLGTHRDHRGQGYGRAVTVAGAAALRELGSSSVLVCTTTSNVGAVATYVSAGLQALPEVRDRHRTT